MRSSNYIFIHRKSFTLLKSQKSSNPPKNLTMLRSIAPLLLALPWLVSGTPKIAPTDECPLLGPNYDAEFDITKTDAFAEAKAAFPGVIDTLFESGVLNSSISSFHVDVFSTVTNTSIYSYSHQATEPAMNESFPAGGIGDKTIFRVGSVSKLFTTYAVLVRAGGLEVFDHPITRYLPELAGNPRDDPLKKIIWEDVTVGTVASHMAGTGQFPITMLTCITPDDPVCNTADFLAYMKDVRVPSQPVHGSALYSDGGFGILGRVLERMTGLPYNDAIKSVLGEPLGFNSTGSIVPTGDDVDAIIIPGLELALSSWGFDNQITAPSGGIYSNAADMRALGISILQSKLLSAAATRLWMKPRAHTSSLTLSFGSPWEINRLTLPVSAKSTRYRVSDLYTKAGGQAGYTTVFALSPDHKLGFSVLVAGATASRDRWTVRAAVGETFITAAEVAGKEIASEKFAGTFVIPGNENTNLTLTVSPDSPGLGLPEFFLGGADARLNITQPGLTLEALRGRKQIIRLYPTGLEERLDNGGRQLKYRAVVQISPLTPRAVVEGGDSLFDDGCVTALNTAFFESPYNTQFYDEFIFELDASGQLCKVIYPAAETILTRE
ncbi:Beta-lactamase [Dactylellina cionopaga]|nr:Beta-lactamase [Dactylellina cionopaga]